MCTAEDLSHCYRPRLPCSVLEQFNTRKDGLGAIGGFVFWPPFQSRLTYVRVSVCRAVICVRKGDWEERHDRCCCDVYGPCSDPACSGPRGPQNKTSGAHRIGISALKTGGHKCQKCVVKFKLSGSRSVLSACQSRCYWIL